MRLLVPKFWIIGSLLIFSSCLDGKKNQSVEVNTPEEVKAKKESVPESFNQEFMDGMTGTLWNYYSKVRLALVQSDVDAVKTAAADMVESFGNEHIDLKEIAKQISDADNLEAQRVLFSDLTKGIEPVFRNALSEGEIYKQFCPMAFDNEGASWLSNVSEVRNPYFGEQMLTCGTTKEIIKSPKS